MLSLNKADRVRKFRATFYLLGFAQASPWVNDPLQALNEIPVHVDKWNPVTMEVLLADGTTAIAGKHRNVSEATEAWLSKKQAA